MEGLGVFIVIAYAIYWVSRQLRRNGIDRDMKNIAKEKGDWYYIDHSGTKVLVADDQPFEYRYLYRDGTISPLTPKNGEPYDVVMINKISRRIIKNVSEEERVAAEKEGREWAIKNNMRLYPISSKRDINYYNKNKQKMYAGIRYRDIKTGNVYILTRNDRWFNIETERYDGLLYSEDEMFFRGIDNNGNAIRVAATQETLHDELTKANEALERSMRENYRPSNALWFTGNCGFDYYEWRFDYLKGAKKNKLLYIE